MPLNKKLLSERDICTKYITPALEAAGWNKHTQFLDEVSFTDGKIYVRGKLATRGKGKRADYILYYKPNIPIAIIEAKDNAHSVRAGTQQALDYARILDIPCVFSSNGDGFLFHDRSAAPFVIAEGDLQSHEGSPAVSRFVIAEGHVQGHEGNHGMSRFVMDEGHPQDHEGSPSVSRFVMAEGHPQDHEGSPSVSRFVIAEGNLCITHDSTLDAEVVFDDDKKSDKSDVNKSDEYRDIERELSLDKFPAPAELWEKYKSYKGIAISLKGHARQLLTGQYASLDAFLSRWNSAERKQAVLEELEEQGIPVEILRSAVDTALSFPKGICHVVYDQPPLTRRERALNVKKRDYFTKYGEQARRVLEALLEKYADEGIENLESLDVLKVRPLTQFGSPIEILREFGGKERFLAAVRELEGEIYRVA